MIARKLIITNASAVDTGHKGHGMNALEGGHQGLGEPLGRF